MKPDHHHVFLLSHRAYEERSIAAFVASNHRPPRFSERGRVEQVLADPWLAGFLTPSPAPWMMVFLKLTMRVSKWNRPDRQGPPDRGLADSDLQVRVVRRASVDHQVVAAGLQIEGARRGQVIRKEQKSQRQIGSISYPPNIRSFVFHPVVHFLFPLPLLLKVKAESSEQTL